MIYRELLNEACRYVRGGLTQQEFYAKYEPLEGKSNLIMKHSIAFSNLWKNFPIWKKQKKQEYTLEESMQIYLSENQLPDDGTDYIKLVSDAGHGECLDAIYRLFFERKDTKKNLVWLYGVSNSGKTTLIKHLETIFCCQDFNFLDKYATLEEPSKGD